MYSKPRACPKHKRIINKEYIRFIKQLPCIICLMESGGKGNWEHNQSDPHHVNPKGYSSMGGKTDDTRTIPLCNRHHRIYHDIGRESFSTRYNIDFEYIISDLNRIWRELNE